MAKCAPLNNSLPDCFNSPALGAIIATVISALVGVQLVLENSLCITSIFKVGRWSETEF